MSRTEQRRSMRRALHAGIAGRPPPSTAGPPPRRIARRHCPSIGVLHCRCMMHGRTDGLTENNSPRVALLREPTRTYAGVFAAQRPNRHASRAAWAAPR